MTLLFTCTSVPTIYGQRIADEDALLIFSEFSEAKACSFALGTPPQKKNCPPSKIVYFPQAFDETNLIVGLFYLFHQIVLFFIGKNVATLLYFQNLPRTKSHLAYGFELW